MFKFALLAITFLPFASAAQMRATTGEARAAEDKLIERLKTTTASPVIEGDTAYFIYRGGARDVQFVGDLTGWRQRGLRFESVEGTNTKFYAQRFAPDARVEYKLIADGEWLLDPLNSNKIDNGVGGENSFVEMPGYRAYKLKYTDINSTFNETNAEDVPSALLGGTRKVRVWLPPQYGSARDERFPVLYLQDGSDYYFRARATLIAREIAEAARVEPFIVVLVDPADRMKEYWANDRFADFMATELVPYIDEHYRTVQSRDARALMGASLGGVISVWTALRHPEVFSRVAGQSTAFWIDGKRVVSALARLPPAGKAMHMRFYFDVGRMESILDVNRRVQTMLRARGYAVSYREAETGHNWTSWRDRLADAYRGVWGE